MKRWIVIISLIGFVFGPLSFLALSDKGLLLRDQALALLPTPKPKVPDGVAPHYDIAYGTHPRQKLDIFLPKNKTVGRLPVILLVHGGGWSAGDKIAMPTTVNSGYLTSHGWMVVSINYRFVPEVSVVEQAQDIMHAVAYIQQSAPHWNANPDQVVVMGHSSGGHLVALATARHEDIKKFGGRSWTSSVALDGSVYDLIRNMARKRSFAFFSPSFGTDPAEWPQASPAHNLKKGMPPLLAVCGRHTTCGHPYAMVEAARKAGVVFEVQPEEIDHYEIGSELGKDNDYTKKVFAFVHKYARPTP